MSNYTWHRPSRRLLLLWAGYAMLGGACLYDSSEPCGPNQALVDGGCYCVDGFGLDLENNTCFPCGANEKRDGNDCVCIEGYRRGPALDCVNWPVGAADPCSSDSDCQNPAYNHCSMEPGRTPYCTNLNCTDDGDCLGGFNCRTDANPTYCEMQPIGFRGSCSSDEDCAGFEATWCDTFDTNSCQVQGCNLDLNDCFIGAQCCDLSQWSAYGAPDTLCVAGDCP